jgi:hypothetical protein
MFGPDRRLVFASTTAAIPPGLLACLLLLAPDSYTDSVQAPWMRGAFPAERRREERLDRAREAVQVRLRAKAVIARDVTEGRLTLQEAAARMRDLDRRTPGFQWEMFRLQHPSATDEERHCREVIGHIRSNIPLGPPLTEELVRRLEAELQGHLNRGTLRLPDVGDPESTQSRPAPSPTGPEARAVLP